ncbi:Dehydrodolichyl diphosphate synthase complex subunit NUS1 [Spathaspora sp. JA1]|nr:Dehydrodolichyl diphosphate synthase complex subunit NUS1 [Spathaspora sp. JA1]
MANISESILLNNKANDEVPTEEEQKEPTGTTRRQKKGIIVPPKQPNEQVNRKYPASATRTNNLLTLSLGFTRDFVKESKPTNSVTEMIIFYVNHFILLSLFFTISIFKNIQFMYRFIFLKILTLSYYPNKSPQVIREDVNKLSKIPKIISCILDLKPDQDENGGILGLTNQISELTAWCISAGVGQLIIYEYTGVLNQSSESLTRLSRYITKNLTLYFGTDAIPTFSITIPHKNIIIYSSENIAANKKVDLEINLISNIDGKPTIVELTKTMCELAINGELSVKDINPELIDEELIELVGPEPDLLISFGPSLDLEDYPPWHIRLTEIYWEPDNKEVSYPIFIRALQQFSNCKVNVGK